MTVKYGGLGIFLWSSSCAEALYRKEKRKKRIREFVSFEMGNCISYPSSNILETKEGCGDLVLCEENAVSNGILKLGSAFSQQGSKGLNQDAAIVYQVCFYGLIAPNDLQTLVFFFPFLYVFKGGISGLSLLFRYGIFLEFE